MLRKYWNIWLLSASLPLVAHADMSTPIGTWKTIDEVSGKPKALVEIRSANGELRGRIVRLFLDAGDDPNPLCEKCSDERHNQPITGMTFLTGLHADGDVYDGGQILDPDSGTVYRAKLHLIDNGQRLEVRGYVGLSVFGRTQVWLRSPP